MSGTLGISRAAIRDWRDNGIDRATPFDYPARPTTLDLAGVAWRRSDHKTVSVSRRESVARLDALIGLKR